MQYEAECRASAQNASSEHDLNMKWQRMRKFAEKPRLTTGDLEHVATCEAAV